MIKQLMLALAVSSVLATPVLAKSSASCALDKGRITVTGYGKAEALPNLAELNFSVSKTDADALNARNSVEKIVSGFIASLEKLGLPKNDIYAASISVYPKYSYEKDNNRKFDGYEALRDVTVSVADFTLISKITDAAMNSGINGINGFVYKIKDTKALRIQADEDAIKDAREQALRLAKGFGVSLGAPCSLSFGKNNEASPLMLARAAALSSNDSATEYLQKKVSVESTVTAVFALDKNDKK